MRDRRLHLSARWLGVFASCAILMSCDDEGVATSGTGSTTGTSMGSSGVTTGSSSGTTGSSSSGSGSTTTSSGGGQGGSGGGATGTGTGGAGGCTATSEVCNGLDDDCNGVTDDPSAVDKQPCDTGLLGACAQGETDCDNGQSTCVTLVSPGSQQETCDGLDNDCDGSPDNGDPGGGASCAASAFGVCANGTIHCTGGALGCHPALPGVETCNGIDDDCDGFADNGNPGGGLVCMTGLQGLCALGVTVCDGANGVACMPNVIPNQLQEACNGLDDDCDGSVDEGIPQVGMPCTAPGFVGICQFGTYSCPAGPSPQLTCDHPLPATVQETCNNQDDDCNGTIDDPAIVNNQPCSSAFPGVCQAGHTQCIGGMSSCVANVMPGTQAELCNALDDNCNGQSDEMNPNPACTQQNPSAQFVQGWACTTGACQIVACQSGHANIDQAPGNGCECVTDGYQNACNTAGAASVPVGGSVDMIGKIESASGSDFLTFNFTVPGVGQPYHPKISLADSAGGQYAMDVLVSCPGTAAGCSTTGGANNESGIQVNVWEQNYNAYTFGAGCCSDNTPRVSSVKVRVYRKFGDQPTCSSYIVTATSQ